MLQKKLGSILISNKRLIEELRESINSKTRSIEASKKQIETFNNRILELNEENKKINRAAEFLGLGDIESIPEEKTKSLDIPF